MIIKAGNPQTNSTPKTYLAVAQGTGVGTIYIKNANGFQANWAIQIGESGEELSEIVLANGATPSGTQIVTAANTVYAHAADTPVYGIKYNQVVFAKSTSGTAGTATPIASGTVNITPDQRDSAGNSFTQYDDTSGASTDAYRAYLLNSATSGSTSFSDWITPGGFTFYSLAKLRDRVKNKLWDSKYIKDETAINDWINEWKDNMTNAVMAVGEDYALGTVDVAFGTEGLGTISTADFERSSFSTNGSLCEAEVSL